MNETPTYIDIKSYKIEPLRGKNAKVALDKVAELLNKVSAKWWISGGTLLGLYRDNDFIPEDEDIDVEILGNEKLFEIMREFNKHGEPIRFMKDSEFTYNYVFKFPDNIIVDLYFYRKNGKHIKSISGLTFKEIGYPICFYTDRTVLEHNGTRYPCLEPERYLLHVYGENWRTRSNEKPQWKPL